MRIVLVAVTAAIALVRPASAQEVEEGEAEDAAPWLDYTAGDGVILRPPDRDFQLTLRGFVWARFDFSARDVFGETTYADEFSIPESRLRFGGILFGGKLHVVLEPSLVVARASPSGSLAARPGLQDGYVELRLDPAAWLRVGQMLVPYDWESNTSPPCLPLAGLGAIPRFFGHGRDLGLMLGGTLPGDRVLYRVSIFNGAGRGNPNDNEFPMTAAFLRFQALGAAAPGWGWSDLDRSTTPNLTFGVGFSYEYEAASVDDYTGVPAGGNPVKHAYDRSVYQANADMFFRWYGLALAVVGHYRGTGGQGLEVTDADGATSVLPDVNAYGYMIHLGYMAWTRTLELLVRYSEIDANVDDDLVGREVLGGLTLFLIGHQAKLTALYGYQWDLPFAAPANADGHVVQLQAQGWF